MDASGNVYVSDAENYRVQEFDAAGPFLLKWGELGTGPGQFFSVAPALRMNVDPAGTVYVCDNGNDRIQQFSPTGALLGLWGRAGTGDGEFRIPHGIAVDAAGNAYVVDYGNGRVQWCMIP